MPKSHSTRHKPSEPQTARKKRGTPCILVTNDDGIHSDGLHGLAETLREIGEVYIIAPDRNQSAVSHSFTMTRPLRATQLDDWTTTIDGTPADCVMFGTKGYLKRSPDLVVSGVNQGPNLGHDTIYSGTVAAAHEGHLSNVPSIAISLNYPGEEYGAEGFDFSASARVAHLLAGTVLEKGLPPGVFLNVNVPHVPRDELQGIAITRLGERQYHDRLIKRTDPLGRDYYWIGGDPPTWVRAEGTDFHALEENKVSVTPLGKDMTQLTAIPELDRWGLTIP